MQDFDNGIIGVKNLKSTAGCRIIDRSRYDPCGIEDLESGVGGGDACRL